MKKFLSLFLLPLVAAGHTDTSSLNNSASSNGLNFGLIIFILAVVGLGYWLLKGGSRK